MLLNSLFEVVSIGMLIPFLGILTNPKYITNNQYFSKIIAFIRIDTEKDLILAITVLFLISAVLSGFMKILYLWSSNRISFDAGAELSQKIYKQYLYQSYQDYYKKNSGEAINDIVNKANNIIYLTIVPVVIIINVCILITSLFFAVMVLDKFLSILIIGCFLILYLIIGNFTKNKLKNNGNILSNSSGYLIRTIQETYGGFRNIVIDGLQEIYYNQYRKADNSLRSAQAENLFLGQFPRHAIEVLAIVVFTLVAYVLNINSGGLLEALPLLGALALAAQRILPLLQHAYGAWANIRSGKASLDDTLFLLDKQKFRVNEVNLRTILFNKEIYLNNISFKYDTKDKYVLNNVKIKILKGKKYGFMGKTGSGKSTLVDLIMGLLNPTTGTIEVDGLVINTSNKEKWQSQIAHVPQNIFLTDNSIMKNIAFGVEESDIDSNRVVSICKALELSDLIESWPEKYDTFVGERGILLSGGQRQRIGIARALYKKVDIIILDEATSALDQLTECNVYRAIENLDEKLTLLIISHKKSNFLKCDEIFEIDHYGTVKSIGNSII